MSAWFCCSGGDRIRPGPDLEDQYTVRSPALFGQTLGIHNADAFFLVGAIIVPFSSECMTAGLVAPSLLLTARVRA